MANFYTMALALPFANNISLAEAEVAAAAPQLRRESRCSRWSFLLRDALTSLANAHEVLGMASEDERRRTSRTRRTTAIDLAYLIQEHQDLAALGDVEQALRAEVARLTSELARQTAIADSVRAEVRFVSAVVGLAGRAPEPAPKRRRVVARTPLPGQP
jgi:hypothetical protein